MGEAPQTSNAIGRATGAGAAPRTADPRAAIGRAALATGVDFAYLLAQARIESNLDPAARAGTSSAAGLYQFTSGTWLRTLDRHGADHGLGWAQAAISDGRVTDPSLRGQIMALRHDPDASARMAAELANDNREGLKAQLGREPDPTELYIAHFLGLGGAGRFLSALAADPGQSAAALMPEAASANRAIFFAGGNPRSVGQVMDLLRGKMAAAMENSSAPTPSGAGIEGWAPAPWQSIAAMPGSPAFPERQGPSAPAPARPSMSETLRDSFGLASGGGTNAPAFVRAAYGKLRSFGL